MRYEAHPQATGWYVYDNYESTVVAECKFKDDANLIVKALNLLFVLNNSVS